MSTIGALNGTDVFLRVFDGVNWLNVGGQVSHSSTFNTALIDITNKFSGSVRELLSGEGSQNMDVTAEFIFVSDASFNLMQQAARTRSIMLFQVWRGMGDVDELAMAVTSFAETVSDSAAVTASISFQSSDAIQRSLAFEFFNVTPEGQFLVAGDIPFAVTI